MPKLLGRHPIEAKAYAEGATYSAGGGITPLTDNPFINGVEPQLEAMWAAGAAAATAGLTDIYADGARVAGAEPDPGSWVSAENS